MNQKAKLAKVLLALASSGMLLQITNCNSDQGQIVLNGSQQITQVLAASFLNSLFYAIGQAAGLPQGTTTTG